MISSAPAKNPENNSRPPLYRTAECRDCAALNATLRARIDCLRPTDILGRNHYLGGRHENLYVSLASIPELRVILDLATAQAAYILKCPKTRLGLGWWLNIMQPGEMTFPHTHDAGDELLSGVYYIDAPPGCGSLLLNDGVRRAALEPRAGSFVFFAPGVMHEVTRNVSGGRRISVGFNVGPAPR